MISVAPDIVKTVLSSNYEIKSNDEIKAICIHINECNWQLRVMYTLSAEQIEGVSKQRSAVMLVDTTDNMYSHLHLISTTNLCHSTHLLQQCHIIHTKKIKVPAVEIKRN